MNVRIETLEGYPSESLVEEICNVDDPLYPIALFEKQLKHQGRLYGCYAYAGTRLVGYKIGYEPGPRYFESLLGALDIDHRRQRIAARMMEVQHEWCKDQWYR